MVRSRLFCISQFSNSTENKFFPLKKGSAWQIQVCNLKSQEVEACRLGVQGQPELITEFWDIQRQYFQNKQTKALAINLALTDDTTWWQEF